MGCWPMSVGRFHVDNRSLVGYNDSPSNIVTGLVTVGGRVLCGWIRVAGVSDRRVLGQGLGGDFR